VPGERACRRWFEVLDPEPRKGARAALSPVLEVLKGRLFILLRSAMVFSIVRRTQEKYMHTVRIKMPGRRNAFHLISRVVAGEKLLDSVAREVLVGMIWKMATFCGIEIVT